MPGRPRTRRKKEFADIIEQARPLAETQLQHLKDVTIASLRDVLVAARSESISSIKRLAWLRDNARAEVVQFSAAVALLDRAWGRPHQMVITKDITENDTVALDALTAEELEIFERLLAKAGAAKVVPPTLDQAAA
jgi:predicted RNase H-like nuclease